MNNSLINNARELPTYWGILEENDFLGKHDVKLDITATGKNGKQANLIIDNAQTCLLGLIKVIVTRQLLKATGIDSFDSKKTIHDVVKRYQQNPD